MVSELHRTNPAESSSEQQIWVPEVGPISTKHFAARKRYLGKLYRLNAEAARAVSEIASFSANFELPSIRTAYMDLYKSEGDVVFEIERNTKPNDINVRYMRDRWTVGDVQGKGAEGLRPWIKTVYRARFIPDKVFSAVAEYLRVPTEPFRACFVRINFKERTFALIAEDKHAESMPGASFAAFALPSATVQTVQTYEHVEDIPVEAPAERKLPEVEGWGEVNETATVEPTMTETQSTEVQATIEETVAEAPVQQQVEAAPVEAAPVAAAPVEAAPVAAAPVEATAAAVETPTETASQPLPPVSSTAESIVDSMIQSERPVPAPSTESAQQPIERIPIPGGSAPMASRHTVAKKTTPKASDMVAPPRTYERPVEKVTYAQPRQTAVVETPKYATYSKSEVDNMLKVQTEQITSALGGKISAQQRTFQEAAAQQEKAFSRVADNFLAQFETARVRLESLTKESQQHTSTELDAFKKQLNKELENYRAQINKTVLPVAKLLEEKPIKVQKETQKSAAAAPKQGRDKVVTGLLAAVLVLQAALMVTSLTKFNELSEMQSQLNEINKRVNQLVDSGIHR